MKRIATLILAVVVLFATAHHSPAPIVEEKPSPPAARSPKAKAADSKSETGPASLSKFNGTWRREASSTDQNGNRINEIRTLLIRNGSTAEWRVDRTAILSPGKTWAGLSAPYNSIAEIRVKVTAKSSELKLDGSNLKVTWPPTEVTEWSPKTIPASFFKPYPYTTSFVYILEGDHLIATDGKTTATWTRVRQPESQFSR
jgi:hypothetical protein